MEKTQRRQIVAFLIRGTRSIRHAVTVLYHMKFTI